MEYVLHCFGFYVLFLSNILWATSKKSLIPYTYEPCGEEYQRHHCLELKCKKKHVMYDVSIMGGVGECLGNSSGLIVDTLNCFWEPVCKVQFPRERLLMGLFSDYKSSSECIREKPEKIKVFNMKCAKKKDVYDVCSSKKLKKKGIIRSHGYNTPFGPLISHSKYPWNYPRHINESVLCTLTWKPPKTSKALFVTVLKSDFAEEDSLTIGGTVAHGNHRNYKFANVGKVDFTLYVGPRQQKGYEIRKSGSGFVLCFKEDRMKKRLFDVCESISKKATKKNIISQVGPRTKQCLLAGTKELEESCCCKADTCKMNLKEAEGFKKSIPANKPNWETCDDFKLRFPCDC